MRTIETNVYSFSELSEKAKEKAHNDWLYQDYYDWSDELGTLEKFCMLFGVEVKEYSFDAYSFHYELGGTAWYDDFGVGNANMCKGIRLCKYMAKQTFYHKQTGRTLTVQELIDECGLTGYWTDFDILRPMRDCCKYKYIPESYEELVRSCLDSFFNSLCSEYKYRSSIEWFDEWCEENDLKFYEDGRIAG